MDIKLNLSSLAFHALKDYHSNKNMKAFVYKLQEYLMVSLERQATTVLTSPHPEI